MKTFTFKATEGELLALIHHHSRIIQNHVEAGSQPTPEMSERLHFLTKKLHKDTPDVDADTDVLNPANQGKQKQEQVSGLAQFEAPKPAPANW